MLNPLLSPRTFISLLLFLWSAASARAAESGLLQWTPGSCNAIAVIRMRKLVESPIGKKENWSGKVRRAYAEGLLSAPPWVREVVRVSTFGSQISGTPATYSLYSMDQKSVIGDVAKHELASSEKIAGSFSVLSPRGIYFVQLAPGILGGVEPPDRQAVSAWVRSRTNGKKTELSPYLKTAVEDSDNALVVLAVDLTDMLNRRQVKDWLTASPRLASQPNVDELASLVASIRGARLGLVVTDTIDGRLRLDFESPVGSRTEALKTVVLQWFDDVGAQMSPLAGAKVTASDKSLTFVAPLDERALRRILSLVRSPHLPGKGDVDNAEKQQPNAVATADYYNSVCDLLNALVRRNQGATDYDKTALWHETFAKKVAELPTTGVDPELVGWGRDVSAKLLALGASLRGVPVDLDQLQKSIRFDDTTYYRWYATSAESGPLYFPSWVKSRNNVGDVRAREAELIAKSTGQRDAIWSMLRNATADIARKMEYKYRIKLKLPT